MPKIHHITPQVISEDDLIYLRFRYENKRDEYESLKYLFSLDGQQAIADGIITLKQYLEIPWCERESMQYLFSPDGRQAVADRIITLEQYLKVPENERYNMQYLFSPDGRQAIDDEIITFKQYLKIPPCDRYSMRHLFSPDGRQAMADGIITIEQYLRIPRNERDYIKPLFSPSYRNDRQAITDKIISLEQYLEIPWHEQKSMQYLFSPDGRQAMDDGIITLERYLQIPYHDRESMQYLFSPDGRRAIDDKIITLEEYLEIPRDKRESMTHLFAPDGRQAMTDEIITIEQYLQFGFMQRESLKYLFSPNGRRAVADRIITLEQFIRIPRFEHEDVITALQDPETRQRIINGQLTIENIIGVRHHAHGVAVTAPNFNGAQSTHNTSVHESSSESATRLANRYKSKIDGAGLERTISKAQAYINSLHGSQKNTAAKKGFSRIIAPDYTFTDSNSQVSLRQLLALTFLAIHDGENRLGSLEDAQMQFVEALYEIQRGYNLSDSGIDQGGQDLYICSPGAFNKFIEKLQGIHPDCQVLYITRENASRKLPIVVREEAMQYLASFTNLNTAEALTTTFTRLKEEGVAAIWPHIKDNIATRIFDEFGSLYQDRADPDFTALVEAGKDLELGDISTLIYDNITRQLDKLEHVLASCKASSIVFKLRALTQDYFKEKKIDSNTYKEKALDIIHQAQPELEKHRDYKQILVNLLILIASLGTAQLINKVCTGNFLFFSRSDSLKKLDDLSNIIEKANLCYFHKPA